MTLRKCVSEWCLFRVLVTLAMCESSQSPAMCRQMKGDGREHSALWGPQLLWAGGHTLEHDLRAQARLA
jgi:hypothetical protein